MDEYVTKLSNKDLKHALKLYEKEKGTKITGLSRADQEALLKQNMQSNKKFKCLAKCKKRTLQLLALKRRFNRRRFSRFI